MTTVLIVQDEPLLRGALRINFQARGYEVIVAQDGTGGLASAARDRPDVIILDLGLPDLDGIEVIQTLRSWTATPVVVLSGRTDRADKAMAMDAGADYFLTKPIAIADLVARVGAVAGL